MEILVTGGHGFIGSHLVEQLLRRGYQVTCLVRPSSDLRWIKDLNIKLVVGDLLKPDTLVAAVRDKEMIFHCAAALKATNAADFDATNLAGTQNLLEAVLSTNPKLQRAVIVSSVAAIGPSPDKNTIITETDTCNPSSDYGRSKLKMEELIKTKYIDKIPITIIRPPIVFGPRDDKCLPLFKLAKYGIHIEQGKYRVMNMVYAPDLARGMIMAGLNERAKGETYFILDPHIYTWKEFLNSISKSLNKKAINIPFSNTLLKFLAFGNEIIAKIRKKETYFVRKRLDDLANPYWLYSSNKARLDFHFETYTPLEKAIQETTTWYKTNHWL